MNSNKEGYFLIKPQIFIEQVRIGLTEVSKLTGVPLSKLQYWDEKGYIEEAKQTKGTTERFRYGYETVRKAALMYQLLGKERDLQKASQRANEVIEAMKSPQHPKLNEALYRTIQKSMLDKTDEIFLNLEKQLK